MTNRAGRLHALLGQGACLPEKRKVIKAHGSNSGPASEPQLRTILGGGAGSRRELRPKIFRPACWPPNFRMPTGESSRLTLQGK